MDTAILYASILVAIVVIALAFRMMIKTKKREPLNISAGRDVQGVIVAGNNQGSIVNVIHQGIDEKKFSRARSDEQKEQGRARVQQWGKTLNAGGEWDWHLLGQAIEYYTDAIKLDPENQHPWTNLAYVFHLIGEPRLAQQCLQESYKLASPGPNHPGRNYQQVKSAVDNGSYLSGGKVARPHRPDWFEEKYRWYLVVDN